MEMTRVGGQAGQTKGTQSRKHSCRHFLLCAGPLGSGWEGSGARCGPVIRCVISYQPALYVLPRLKRCLQSDIDGGEHHFPSGSEIVYASSTCHQM